MYSDNTYVVIILVLFFFFWAYIKFLITKSIMKYEWSELKCNPLHMLAGSIMNSKDGEKTFQECVKENTMSKLYGAHYSNMENYGKNVESSIKAILNDVDNNQSDISSKQQEIQDYITDSNNKIANSIETQNKINQAIIDSSEPISNLTEKMAVVSDKFKLTMQNFIDSSLVEKLKSDD